MYLYNKMARDVSPVAMFLLGKSSIVKKILFVKSLHKMVTPLPPSPFYEVPIYLFFRPFFDRKKDDFEGCLKGVDGCFKGA